MKTIKAKKGYRFALKDKSAVYDNIIYMPDDGDEKRFIQVTEAEAEKIKEEIEKKMKEEIPHGD